MGQTLIKWRLREVMARYHIKAIDLAKEMGVSANAISNLRKSDTMPRLDGDSLNNLCNALNKLALNLGEQITPTSLIDYTCDYEPDNESQSSTTSALSQSKHSDQLSQSRKNNPHASLLIIIPEEVPESA